MDHQGSLEERIAASLNSLSPKQKRLARFVLDSKYFMSFASASQAGEKTGTSAATVVRFAQTLGYDGFSEMQAALRGELPSYLTAVERIQAHLSALPTRGDVAQQVFSTDISNIQRTANNLDDPILDQLVEEIAAARRIFVVGSGLSAAAALFLAHSLKVIGFEAHALISAGLTLAVEAAQIGSGDLLVAIDLWRYVRSTVQTAQSARQAGARLVAITDSIVSPLAELADFALEVATDGVAHSLSLTALFSLLNVLIARLSFRVPEQIMESLRRVDAAYRGSDLLIME